MGLIGTKEGCGNGECGACTVIVDKLAINSCLYLAVEADGKTIETIEGLASTDGTLHPIQQSFVDNGGIQCGFCTGGMELSALFLLENNPSPTDLEIRAGLSGNLCRCTGYTQILKAIAATAEGMKK